MIFPYNRFAIVPHMCNECKRYVWMEPYRRSDVWHEFAERFLKENICRECLPKYIPQK